MNLQDYPPLSTGEHGAMVRVIASDGSVHDLPEKWLCAARRIDPDLRLIPGRDFNVLVLTAEDRAFLWGMRITSEGEDRLGDRRRKRSESTEVEGLDSD